MRPATPFSFPGIREDVAKLGRLLALGLRTVDWQSRGPLAILNLACGRADETGILLETLSPAASRLSYLGIDLRAPEIAEARARWIPAVSRGQEIEFHTLDASRADRRLPSADFIFIRHQNFWDDGPAWTRLYRNALAALKPTGLLAITSYFDREHLLATTCLGQLGARKLTDLPHPLSRPLADAAGKSVDRHLALFAHQP